MAQVLVRLTGRRLALLQGSRCREHGRTISLFSQYKLINNHLKHLKDRGLKLLLQMICGVLSKVIFWKIGLFMGFFANNLAF